MTKYRVLYLRSHRVGYGSAFFIDQSWINAINSSGDELSVVSIGEPAEIESLVYKSRFDLIVCPHLTLNEKVFAALCHAKKRGSFVCVTVDHDPEDKYHKVIKAFDPANCYFGEIELESARRISDRIAKDYWLLPCAADGSVHKIYHDVVDKIVRDLVFIGAKNTDKATAVHNVLSPLRSDKEVRALIDGPFWSTDDKVKAIIAKGLRFTTFDKLADKVALSRVKFSAKDEAMAYFQSVVSINVHEVIYRDYCEHNILNARAYKIAASGGMLLCDNVPALSRYFEIDKECLVHESLDDVYAIIKFFRKNLVARKRLIERASKRATNEHLMVHRYNSVKDLAEKGSPSGYLQKLRCRS